MGDYKRYFQKIMKPTFNNYFNKNKLLNFNKFKLPFKDKVQKLFFNKFNSFRFFIIFNFYKINSIWFIRNIY